MIRTSTNRGLNEVMWKEKMHSDDRILKLQVIDGTKPKTSQGITDPRLFTGENEIHAIRNEWNYWVLKYKQGNLPPALDQSFTTFDKLLQHTTAYFLTRNVSVTSVEEYFGD